MLTCCVHPAPLTTAILVVSFHALTKCKFCNSFALIFMQDAEGGPALPSFPPVLLPRAPRSWRARVRPARAGLHSAILTSLVPPSAASCVSRHMRFKSDDRRTFGTGTLPKRFISQPYAGILKCDSSSHPRTNCGMAQYRMNGSKRFTWLDMKKHVR